MSKKYSHEVISSWKPGPKIWIVAMLHGNETIWWEIHNFLREKTIHNGEIHLIIWNIEASNKFLLQDNPLSYRYIDHDLNRIWDETFVEWSYEYIRRDQLKPLLLQCDIIIDIHSFSRWWSIVWICTEENIPNALEWMNVEKILVQNNTSSSMTSWCARNWKKSFWIELWNHLFSQKNLDIGLTNIRNLCIYFWLTLWQIKKNKIQPEILFFDKEIKITTDKFRFSKDFASFNNIAPGEIIAYDDNNIITNPYMENVIFGIVNKNILKWRTAWFIFKSKIQ